MTNKANDLLLANMETIVRAVKHTAKGVSAVDHADMVQEVIVRILSDDRFALFDATRGRIEQFVFSMVRNMTIDALRRTRDTVEADDTNVTAITEGRAAFPSPEAVTVRRDYKCKLERAIGKQLGAEDFADYLAITQTDYDMATHADVRGVSIETFHVRLFRLKARIAEVSENL